ncbi:MAG: thermonuclease family protein [Gemmatimonadetes bacterium]|nr:thermonuclease family protein [Gemmatimonadota bacterium]
MCWGRRPTALGVCLAAALLTATCMGDGDSTSEPREADDRARYGGRSMRIDRVIDGDTAVLEDGTSVRYIGIDAPESRPTPQCGAEAATRANEAWVESEVVTIRLDPAETRDRFGRLLAYLETDRGLVNVALVRQGFACAFPFGSTRLHREEIAAAERAAKEAGSGVWGSCPPIPDGCPPAR